AVSDALFNDLALRLFRYQFENNAPYRRFSLSQKKEPTCVKSWEEIPFLPVKGFKFAEIACRPISETARLFHSSGTTLQERSRHYLFDLDLSEAAILPHFKRHLMPEGRKMRLAILIPSPEEAPHSSLSHMIGVVRSACGTKESRYYIERGRLQSERLAFDLAEAKGPVSLLGTSFSFVHFIDFYRERAFPVRLPEGSRLMDTGGFKGRSREVPRETLYGLYQNLLGLSPEYCVNEYGMAEMTSQFYDGVAGRPAPRVYNAPPQVRTRVLNPVTLEPAPKGEAGLLAHLDLANIDSAAAILSEDIGREAPGGFTLAGRASGAELKGCSLTLDDLLQKGVLKGDEIP
ncbi:MAG TPA: hypothetical protein VIK48_00505, partial [Candidatus Manganitrophaceae bacterium]